MGATVTSQPTKAGIYAEYEQPAEETGLDGPSLIYVGPYASTAEAVADGQGPGAPNFLGWITHPPVVVGQS